MNPEEQLIQQRIEKIRQIREMGINPYPYKFNQKNHSSEILEKFRGLKSHEQTKEKVSMAGRIMTIRLMGKASFLHLQDETGKIQVYLRQDDIGEKSYNLFKKFDIGDIMGVEGLVFKTKAGEISIWAKKIELLSKSIRPLPEKWHGLKDTEIRYRKRYLDLISNPGVKETFILRSKIINSIRNFLKNKEYLEVETPILQPIYGGGFAKPFITHHNKLKMKMYLRISNEMYLKRLIVGGFEKVFEFSQDFRNESIDTTHNPEFLAIEMMTAYVDYFYGMDLLEDLMIHVCNEVLGTTKVKYQEKIYDLSKWNRLTMVDSIKKYLKIDVEGMDANELKNFAIKRKIKLVGMRKGELINSIFEGLVQPELAQPTIIYDYPVEVSPLARECKNKEGYTERFEMFIHGVEYGNNYTELTDPKVIEKRFKEELKRGEEGDEEAHPMDKDFVEAMEYGMPATCGTAIGMDRFIMLLTDSSSIRDVILFPTLKKLIFHEKF